MAIQARSFFSSHVQHVLYDDVKKELAVTYKNGTTSVHGDVPSHVADKIMTAESVGTALHAHVRGKYEHSYKGVGS